MLPTVPEETIEDDFGGKERVKKALELVDQYNRLARQKSGGFFDSESLEFTRTCPFCELECLCLGPSCLRKKGIIGMSDNIII